MRNLTIKKSLTKSSPPLYHPKNKNTTKYHPQNEESDHQKNLAKDQKMTKYIRKSTL